MTSKMMGNILAEIRGYATKTSAPILLLGESGVGKTHIAQQFHHWTGRKGLLVVVDCGAIPAGLIESHLFGHTKGAFTGAVSNQDGAFKQADGGTIFLDEIGELPLDMQTRLLRAVQDQVFRPVGGRVDVQVDVRVIAATNKDLLAEVKAGRFRPDLRFRLSAFPVTIPPLRERRDEIEGLVMAHLNARRLCLAEGVLDLFSFAEWPGNVRELLWTAERAAVSEWTAERAAAELRVVGARESNPVGGRQGRFMRARGMGWWSATELAVACGVHRATVFDDLKEWVADGVVEKDGEGRSVRYRVVSCESCTTHDDTTEPSILAVGGEP